MSDANEGRPEIQFDVDGEGFDGRNVEDAAAFSHWRWRGEHEAVDAPEECGEGFAGTGGGEGEGGVAAGNGGPAEDLGAGGFGENGVEPVADGRVEGGEWMWKFGWRGVAGG